MCRHEENQRYAYKMTGNIIQITGMGKSKPKTWGYWKVNPRLIDPTVRVMITRFTKKHKLTSTLLFTNPFLHKI